jgi:hypothetical protein
VICNEEAEGFMKTILKILITIIAGLAVGIVSALWSFGAIGPKDDELSGKNRIDVDGWNSDLSIGSNASDIYTKAYVARRGLLALSRAETIYFMRSEDDQGQKLDPNCKYQINGSADIPARWWSITLYAEDDYLTQNGDNAHSVSASTIDVTAPLNVQLGPNRPSTSADWISSNQAGAYSLTLRMYNPHEIALSKPQSLDLPDVKRLSCARDNDSGGQL